MLCYFRCSEQYPNFASTFTICETHQKAPNSEPTSTLIQKQVLLVPGQLCTFCADAFDICLHRALLLGNIKKQKPNGFVPPVTWPGMEPWWGRFVFGIFLCVVSLEYPSSNAFGYFKVLRMTQMHSKMSWSLCGPGMNLGPNSDSGLQTSSNAFRCLEGRHFNRCV